MYITVSQNAQGLAGNCELSMTHELPNVLVMSAGGYGHVPLPLLKQPERRNNAKPIAARAHAVSYVGGLGNAPRRLRSAMAGEVKRTAAREGFDAWVGQTDKWRDVMADSRASLCPRGFGRTSYVQGEGGRGGARGGRGGGLHC